MAFHEVAHVRPRPEGHRPVRHSTLDLWIRRGQLQPHPVARTEALFFDWLLGPELQDSLERLGALVARP